MTKIRSNAFVPVAAVLSTCLVAGCSQFEVPEGVSATLANQCEAEVSLIANDPVEVDASQQIDDLRSSPADQAMSQARAAQREQKNLRSDESEWPRQVLFNRCLRRNGVVLAPQAERELNQWQNRSRADRNKS